MTAWTEDRTGRALAMWKLNATYREIAYELGVTRNSVSGLIFRLGFSNKIKPRKPQLTREQKAERQQRANMDRRLAQTIHRARARPHVKTIPGDFLGVSLLDLTWVDGLPAQCRYPQGDGPFVFCGQEVHQGSYCAEHHRLCYGRPAATPEQTEQARKMRAAKGRVYGRAA